MYKLFMSAMNFMKMLYKHSGIPLLKIFKYIYLHTYIHQRYIYPWLKNRNAICSLCS